VAVSVAERGRCIRTDKGYLKIEDIEACEKAGIDPYVPRPQRGPSVREGLFRKDEFSYDPASDSLLCPVGQVLQPYSSSTACSLTPSARVDSSISTPPAIPKRGKNSCESWY
jgi:hypothetical protein